MIKAQTLAEEDSPLPRRPHWHIFDWFLDCYSLLKQKKVVLHRAGLFLYGPLLSREMKGLWTLECFYGEAEGRLAALGTCPRLVEMERSGNWEGSECRGNQEVRPFLSCCWSKHLSKSAFHSSTSTTSLPKPTAPHIFSFVLMRKKLLLQLVGFFFFWQSRVPAVTTQRSLFSVSKAISYYFYWPGSWFGVLHSLSQL